MRSPNIHPKNDSDNYENILTKCSIKKEKISSLSKEIKRYLEDNGGFLDFIGEKFDGKGLRSLLVKKQRTIHKNNISNIIDLYVPLGEELIEKAKKGELYLINENNIGLKRTTSIIQINKNDG